MLGPFTDEIARMQRADLREQACRDRLLRLALRAAGGERRRSPLLRGRRSEGFDATC